MGAVSEPPAPLGNRDTIRNVPTARSLKDTIRDRIGPIGSKLEDRIEPTPQRSRTPGGNPPRAAREAFSTFWNVVEGACIYFIEATGARDETFSIISGGDDANHMLANATWR